MCSWCGWGRGLADVEDGRKTADQAVLDSRQGLPDLVFG